MPLVVNEIRKGHEAVAVHLLKGTLIATPGACGKVKRKVETYKVFNGTRNLVKCDLKDSIFTIFSRSIT